MEQNAGKVEDNFTCHFNEALGRRIEPTTISSQVHDCQKCDHMKRHELETRVLEHIQSQNDNECPSVEES